MTARRGGLVHHIAGCRNCAWTAYGRNAQPIAAVHARAKGHTTWVELGFAYEYGP